MHSVSQSGQRSVKAFASLGLTPREAEVLFWISHGKSNHDIAVILAAKTGTVRKHVEHVLSKLNVENRTAAAVMALEKHRAVAPRTESKPDQFWVAIASMIATELSELWSGACEIYEVVPALIG